MTNALRQFTFTEKSFATCHGVGTLFYLSHDILYTFQTTCLVSFYSFLELLETELDVVEVLNGFTQLSGNICEHCLEVTKGFTYNL